MSLFLFFLGYLLIGFGLGVGLEWLLRNDDSYGRPRGVQMLLFWPVGLALGAVFGVVVLGLELQSLMERLAGRKEGR